jgi:hypothetical protein
LLFIVFIHATISVSFLKGAPFASHANPKAIDEHFRKILMRELYCVFAFEFVIGFLLAPVAIDFALLRLFVRHTITPYIGTSEAY